MREAIFNKEYFKKRDYLDPKISSSIVSLARNNKFEKILDVGCGTGKLVKYLVNKGFKVVGCDPFSIREPNKLFIKAKATSLPFPDNSFDLLTSVSVVEHLEKKECSKFIDEAGRVLRPGGCIFLVTPNFNSVWRFVFGKKWFGYSDPTHINFFTPSSLSMLIRKKGFKEIQLSFCMDNPRFLDYLLVSTPLWRIRDSFYVAGKK